MRTFRPAAAVIALFVAIVSQAAAEPIVSGVPASNRILKLAGDGTVPNGLGINIHDSDDREQQLDLVKAMGFHLIRTDVLWSRIETKAGVYDWSEPDALIAMSQRRGLLPLLILAYSNPLYSRMWHAEGSRIDWAYEPPMTNPARDAFAAFARAAAERYRGQVIWEIWNEPNLSFGKPVRLEAYIRLAIESCRAMRSAYSDAAIVGPASAGFDLRFLEDFVKGDKDACFDAISVHPYRDRDPESVLDDWQRLNAVLAKSDRSRTKIAINSEWGYSVQGGVWTERRQAEYVLRSYLADLLAGVPITIIYDLRNDGPDPRDKEQNFGMLDFQGKPKTVAISLAAMVRDLRGLSVLGKVPAQAGSSILVFGAPGRPLKIVAWSVSSQPIRLMVGPALCVEAQSSPTSTCRSDEAIVRIDPLDMIIDGRPTVFDVQVQSCSTSPNAKTTFAAWCDERQRVLR